MPFNGKRCDRRPNRLKGYDYSLPGAYFVTAVTRDRLCLFGEIIDADMRLNEYGDIVRDVWLGLPEHYPDIELDEYVVMLNHFHGILVIVEPGGGTDGTGLRPVPTKARHGLPEMMRGFKSFSARGINQVGADPGQPLWQRSYYDRIIRDDAELNSARQYILDNPLKWALDRDNPDF